MRKKRLFNLLHLGIGAPSAAALGLTVLSVVFTVTLAWANGANRVGLVVVHGDDNVITQCIEFSEDEISGLEVLERSGLDLNIDATGGLGSIVCRIDHEGCTFPEEACFCQCTGSPCVFWSYWQLINDGWQFSGLGASSLMAKDGDVQGWVWGEGSPSGGGSSPPLMTFDQICAPPPTDTPTPANTPTNTPEPTNTAEPTDTPTPVAAPIIHHFTADRFTINSGEGVLLSWDLAGAKAAYLQYDGLEEGVIAPGGKTVSPANTTVYTLIARNDGGEVRAEITITVNGTAPLPTPVGASLPTATPLPPSDASIPPTAPPAPEPIIDFSAGAPAVPSGACTTLHWAVQNASAVYLDGVQVAEQASLGVCPEQRQVYTLRVVYPGGERTAQLTLEVADTIAPQADTPSDIPAITATIGPTASPTQPPVEAALVSQNTAPTVAARSANRDVPPRSSPNEQDTSSLWARLGIWGGLVGGWCLIATLALIAWGGIWWMNSRKFRK